MLLSAVSNIAFDARLAHEHGEFLNSRQIFRFFNHPMMPLLDYCGPQAVLVRIGA